MTDKSIRIGTDDFAKIRHENGYFVDKSSLIREVIRGSDVLLLPRPRRFGKTLNLSMLRYFFERVDNEERRADRRGLFADLEISRDSGAMRHFGRYPTIFLSLKKIGGGSWEEALATFRMVFGDLFRRYSDWFSRLPAAIQRRFDALAGEVADETVMRSSLADLVSALHSLFGEPVVVLLDEYDSPAIEAFRGNYLDEMLNFLRAWLGAGLKHENGPALYRAVITGILRIARESIFSGLNNLDVATTLRIGPFADKFGFTEAEVEQLLRDFDCEDRMPEVRDWYNGYKFGEAVVYNPWSVLSFVDDLPAPIGPKWLNTSSNDLIHEELAAGGAAVRRDLEKLLAGAELRYPLREDTVFSDVGRAPENIWSFLCFAGYLRAEDPRSDIRGRLCYRLSIPNREVALAYQEFVERTFWRTASSGGLDAFLGCFLDPARLNELDSVLRELAVGLMSYHQVGGRFPEVVYHAFVLGLLANLRGVYEILSEPESGYGRADILMVPKTEDYPHGYVIEFKSLASGEDLEASAAAALEQIEKRAYAARLREAGVAEENIRRLAVVVRGKEVCVRYG